jgi:hypothetical protein
MTTHIADLAFAALPSQTRKRAVPLAARTVNNALASGLQGVVVGAGFASLRGYHERAPGILSTALYRRFIGSDP